MLHCLSWVGSRAKKSCHQNKLFLSSSVLLSGECFFYVPPFLLSCVVWSSSRIFSATDHHTNTFQNTQWGVRVANACKCNQEAKEGVSRAQSKIASGNKQLGETEVQAAWKDVYIYIDIRMCTEHLEWDCRQNPPVLDVRFVWECGTSWISYMSDSCSLSPPSGLRIKMLGLPCNQKVVSHEKISKIIHLYCTHVSEILTGLLSRSLMPWINCARRVCSLKKIGTFSLKPDQIDLKCNFGTTRASKQRLLHAWPQHMHVFDVRNCSQTWGLASLWFTPYNWFINIPSAAVYDLHVNKASNGFWMKHGLKVMVFWTCSVLPGL